MEKMTTSVLHALMDGEMKKEDLIKFFAEFWGINKSEINDFLKINNQDLENFSSIRFFQFIAAVESNFDVKIENVDKIVTFQDLLNNLK